MSLMGLRTTLCYLLKVQGKIIGGFFKPDLNRVAALEPDVIFYAGLQKEVVRRFQDKAVLINLMPTSIKESFDHIRLLAALFDKRAAAEAIIKRQQEQLDIIRRKVAHIAPDKRMRVMRLMGRTSIMTPGDDSFQNEFIRAAGGFRPYLGKKVQSFQSLQMSGKSSIPKCFTGVEEIVLFLNCSMSLSGKR